MGSAAAELERAIAESGLADGMRISFHHHVRFGDRVVGTVLPVLEMMGLRDLTLCVSSVMGEACEAVARGVTSGLIRRIETTGLKEPLSGATTRGELPEPVVFRTHGGRALAIESGRTPIDVAFVAASAADQEGNLTGAIGPNRFGSLGYAKVDAAHAAHVIGITDTVVESPIASVGIPAAQVNDVVVLPTIGDRELIGQGSLRRSERPIDHIVAGRAARAIDACGIIRDGFAYQAGSGGVSLLVTAIITDIMRERGITGRFASGGITAPLVEALEEGLFRELYDVQSFDDAATQSLFRNPRHYEMSAAEYASPARDDCIAHRLDAMVLSGTEIDLAFNLNSLTGTNGAILGALGGAPDTAEGARLTVVVLPSMRGRIPTINERVRTICTPGRHVDLLVTERGICVNPLREDVAKGLRDAGIATLPIASLMETVHRITGRPHPPPRDTPVVAVVEERRGGRLDTIPRVSPGCG